MRVDLVVNLCESYRGIPQLEPHVAALFELLALPFTGNTHKTLALCQDKHRAKAVLAGFGLAAPRGRLAVSADFECDLSFPVISKPNCEDASLGIHADAVSRDRESLRRRIESLLETYQQPALVEEYIPGREFNVAVLDLEKPRALPVSEIVFQSAFEADIRICSYEAKWLEDHALYRATPPVCPAEIPEALRERLQDTAVAAFRALECRDYARVDFRLHPGGVLYILEVNPNPDISPDAGYSRALSAAGIAYGDFWLQMINKALMRRPLDDSKDVRVRPSQASRDPEKNRRFHSRGDRSGGGTDGDLPGRRSAK
jgi:D-alanine-D-alanine ligase